MTHLYLADSLVTFLVASPLYLVTLLVAGPVLVHSGAVPIPVHIDDEYIAKFYQYGYQVEDTYTGDYHGHREHTSGELTTGEYKVKLPDGRIQVVSYEADHHGFRPRITYEPAKPGDHPAPHGPPPLEVVATPPEVHGAPPHLHHSDPPYHPPPPPPAPHHHEPHQNPEYRELLPTPIPKSLPKHPLHKSITDMLYKIDTPKGPIHVLAYKPDMGPGHAQEIKFLPLPAHAEPGYGDPYHPPPTPTPDYTTPKPVHYVEVKSPHPPPHHVMDYHPPAPKPHPPPPPPPKEYHHPEPPAPHHEYKSLPAELVKQLGAHIKMLHMPDGYNMPHHEPEHPQHYAYDPTAQYAIVVAKPTPKPHPPPPPPPPPTYAPTPPPPTPIHYTTPQPAHNIHKKSIQLMQMDENGNLTPLSLYYPPVPHPHSPKPAIRFAEERIDVEEVNYGQKTAYESYTPTPPPVEPRLNPSTTTIRTIHRSASTPPPSGVFRSSTSLAKIAAEGFPSSTISPVPAPHYSPTPYHSYTTAAPSYRASPAPTTAAPDYHHHQPQAEMHSQTKSSQGSVHYSTVTPTHTMHFSTPAPVMRAGSPVTTMHYTTPTPQAHQPSPSANYSPAPSYDPPQVKREVISASDLQAFMQQFYANADTNANASPGSPPVSYNTQNYVTPPTPKEQMPVIMYSTPTPPSHAVHGPSGPTVRYVAASPEPAAAAPQVYSYPNHNQQPQTQYAPQPTLPKSLIQYLTQLQMSESQLNEVTYSDNISNNAIDRSDDEDVQQKFQHFPSSTLAPQVNYVTSPAPAEKHGSPASMNHVLPISLLSKEYLKDAGLLHLAQNHQAIIHSQPKPTPAHQPTPRSPTIIQFSSAAPPQEPPTPSVRRAPPTPFYMLKPTPGPTRAAPLVQTAAPPTAAAYAPADHSVGEMMVYEKPTKRPPKKPVHLTPVPTENKKRSTTQSSKDTNEEDVHPQQHPTPQHVVLEQHPTQQQILEHLTSNSQKPIQVISYVPEPGSGNLVAAGQGGAADSDSDKPYIYIVSTYQDTSE